MKEKIKKVLKWSLIIFGLLILLGIFSSGDSAKKSVQKGMDAAKQTVEQKNITVTSQLVKKVSGKCRYFFDIRNNDSKDFSGSVEITLQKNPDATLGKETFNTTKPIEPTLGNSVYLDINTCPAEQVGETGISKYKFVAKVDSAIVAQGEGNISNKYEDLSTN